MKAFIKTLPLAIAAVTLVACNAEQDGGKSQAQNMNGQAVDGRIANGLVWVDRNGNGKWDSAIEPSARTDSEGFFSFNPRTNRDYCALPSTSLSYRHCLEYSSNNNQAQIMITGGIDVSTGERLKAAMVLGTTLADASNTNGDTMKRISPISTLLNAVDSSNDRAQILDAIAGSGATESEVLTQDFSEASTSEQRRLLANAVTVVSLQNLINSVKGSEGSNQTTAQRQTAIAAEIAKRIAEVPGLLDDPAELDNFLDEQLSNVDAARLQVAKDSARAVRTALKAIEDAVIADTDDAKAKVSSLVRTAEIAFQLARRAAVDNDADAAVRVQEFTTAVAQNIADQFATLGADDDLDVQSFTNAIKSQSLTGADFAAAKNGARLQGLPEGEVWGGNTWRVFRVDPNSDSGDTDDIDVDNTYMAMLFTDYAGQPGTGQIWACFNVEFDDEAENDTGFNLNKQFVFGSWDQLSRARIAIELQWNRFLRDGQLVYGGLRDPSDSTSDVLYRINHDGEEARNFNETMILDPELTATLADYGPGGRGAGSPISNAGCQSIHNMLFPSDT
ncbi:hypothetical protein NFC81_06425 [Salinispirillum sp. LH 10-3-1]|uniref:Uncharacterized protein n=1 Tax=Salinispirillum sp. LH 10-3-1 TaxID=2952525 RepID=A0AB38YIZ7_9GAMM